MHIKFIQGFLLTCALLLGAGTPALAGETDPLFINLTTDEGHRALAGLTFGLHQHDSGHPLTVFLNDRGVLLGSTAHAGKHAAQQAMLVELMKKGAIVLIAPLSMKHHGVAEADLLPGLQVSNRKLSGDALFGINTRALSW